LQIYQLTTEKKKKSLAEIQKPLPSIPLPSISLKVSLEVVLYVYSSICSSEKKSNHMRAPQFADL